MNDPIIRRTEYSQYHIARPLSDSCYSIELRRSREFWEANEMTEMAWEADYTETHPAPVEPAPDADETAWDTWDADETAWLKQRDADLEVILSDPHTFVDWWNRYSESTTAPEGIRPKYHLEVVDEDDNAS